MPPPMRAVSQAVLRASRMHSRLIIWGSFGSLRPTAPAELLLHGLPPNKTKWKIIAAACGAKHFVLLTSEGTFVVAGRVTRSDFPSASMTSPSDDSTRSEMAPRFFDTGLGPNGKPDCASCGCSSTLLYRKGTRTVIAFGDNSYGQLGLGHKDPVGHAKSRTLSFAEWEQGSEFWASVEHRGDHKSGTNVAIEKIVCGFNHTLLLLTDGSVYACGANTFGELGIGTKDSPFTPQRVEFPSGSGRVVDAAAGNGWTLFLTEEGRIFGCGSWTHGQLDIQSHTPRIFPFLRVGTKKLMRAKFVSCGAQHGLYVTQGNEVFIRGSVPDFGFMSAQSRLHPVLGSPEGAPWKAVRTHSLTSFFIDADDGIWGIGANTEGQLDLARESPSFDVQKFHNVLKAPPRGPTTSSEVPPVDRCLGVSHTFAVLVDDEERYELPKDNVPPVVLPPISKSNRGAARAALGRKMVR